MTANNFIFHAGKACLRKLWSRGRLWSPRKAWSELFWENCHNEIRENWPGDQGLYRTTVFDGHHFSAMLDKPWWLWSLKPSYLHLLCCHVYYLLPRLSFFSSPGAHEKQTVDVFHNGDWIQYSSVPMLLCLSNLAVIGKIQTNISTKMRSVGLIDINIKPW